VSGGVAAHASPFGTADVNVIPRPTPFAVDQRVLRLTLVSIQSVATHRNQTAFLTEFIGHENGRW
jgi:hypothetical protein